MRPSAAVGAAVGGRLQSLDLIRAEPPATDAAAARALHTLAACYPHLQALTLHMSKGIGMSDGGAEALLRSLLQPGPTLAALCPALKQVVVQLQRGGDKDPGGCNCFHSAEWLRPGEPAHT